MTPAEFRQLRHQAGLSYRKAASELGVARSTIQRWEAGDAAIPSTAADALRRIAYTTAEHQEPNMTVAYRLGRLVSLLEWVLDEESESYRLHIDTAPAQGLPPLVARAHQAAHTARRSQVQPLITDLMGTLPDIPAHLSERESGQYWLGYYHQRGELRAASLVSGGETETE